METLPALASGASPIGIVEALEEREELPGRLMLVGHNPDLSMLVASLCGGSSLLRSLEPSGIAKLEGELAFGRMRLAFSLSPRDLI